MTNRPSDFVTHTRNDFTTLMDAIDRLRARRAEWDTMDYGNALEPAGAFIGDDNSDITANELGACIGTTLDALNTLLAAGHATNINKIRR